MQAAFQIERTDNVATALKQIDPGPVRLYGDAATQQDDVVLAVTAIPQGHKLALRDIAPGEMIIKYGVPIGRATAPIPMGSWVHLHVMCSNYDERSSHLDVITGAPKDILYE